MAKKIGLMVGSLREESFNKKLAQNLVSMFPLDFQPVYLDIGHLGLYSQDLEGDRTPSSWTEFRERIKSLDGLLIVTPEYNRSVPGVLKNALDIASRPFGQNAWANLPTAVASSSISNFGGFGANQQLRQTLAYLNMPTLCQPEVIIGKIQDHLDEKGKLTDDKLKEFLQTFVDAFVHWVVQFQVEPKES